MVRVLEGGIAKNEAIGLLLAVACILCGVFAPVPSGLSVGGFRCLCCVVAAVALWCTNALPNIATSLFIIIIVPALGVLSVDETFAATGTNGMFFILSAFGIAAGALNTSIPQHLLHLILRITGNDSRKIVMGYILLASAFSVIVVDAAACTVAFFALSLMKAIGNPKPGTSNLGRALMIGIPFGALAGGIALPTSSIVNIVALSILEGFGFTMSYAQWACIGIPLAIVGTVAVALTVAYVCKPEALTDEQFESLLADVSNIGSLTGKDIRFMIIIVTMVVCWIWGFTNSAIVSCAGVVAMLLPGIRIMTGEELVKQINPVPLVLICAIMVLVAAMRENAVGTWIVDTCFAGVSAWPPMLIIAMMVVVSSVLHLCMPAGAACLTVAGAVMIPVAINAGLSLAGVGVLLAYWCGIIYLLPTDAIFLMTFGFNYYKFADVVKVGIIPTLVMALATVVLCPLIGGLV